MATKNHKYLFALNRIFVNQFAIVDESYAETEGENILFTHGMDIGGDDTNRILSFTMKVDFKKDDKIFLIIEAGCEFRIEPDSWKSLETESGKRKLLPKQLGSHLVGLTISTVRGILYAKTQNTVFNKFFIPLINIQELVKEDMQLEIEGVPQTT